MSQHVEGATKTFLSGAALAANLRVKLVAGVLQLAGVADDDLGTTEYAVFAASVPVAVRLRTASGTVKMVADGSTILAGGQVRTAASGKVAVTNASGSRVRGIALEASSADGDVIEVLQSGTGLTSTT
jgi:hypothetical protein